MKILFGDVGEKSKVKPCERNKEINDKNRSDRITSVCVLCVIVILVHSFLSRSHDGEHLTVWGDSHSRDRSSSVKTLIHVLLDKRNQCQSIDETLS